MRIKLQVLFVLALLGVVIACCDDKDNPTPGLGDVYLDTVYDYPEPNGFPTLESPDDNPMTKRGVELGRMLFYDPILSSDSTINCASCHKPDKGFSDNERYSVGVNGAVGNIQAMPLINLAWTSRFFLERS